MRTTRRGALAAGLAGLTGCVGTQRSEPSPVERTRGVHLGFVGDAMLGRGISERWADADPSDVWGSTLDRLQSLDGLVLNLECAITAHDGRWPEKTYYFRADPAFAQGALDVADASVAALANNHVLDFEVQGLEDTLTHLDEVGVEHAGAGADLDAALEPAITEIGGLTVATLSFTDRWSEFAAAADRAGSAYFPLDPAVDGTRTLVRTALARAVAHDPDIVIASVHWGENWETHPEPRHEAFGRWLIEQGVDVVHGHSAHVLQGVEVYRGSPIIYDAGDFVDDYVEMDDVYNKRSGLFELRIVDGNLDALSVVPTEIVDQQARIAEEDAAAWVREAIRDRSAPYDTTVDEDGVGVRIPLAES